MLKKNSKVGTVKQVSQQKVTWGYFTTNTIMVSRLTIWSGECIKVINMSEGNSRILIQKQVETELVHNHPDPKIIILANSERHKLILFGNLGFQIRFVAKGETSENTFDYTPEERLLPNIVQTPKYVSVLGLALHETWKFLNDPAALAKINMSDKNIEFMSAVTNINLLSTIKGIFSRGDQDDLISDEEYSADNPTRRRVTIHLKRFTQLPPDSPLIQYLERLGERAKTNTLTYHINTKTGLPITPY